MTSYLDHAATCPTRDEVLGQLSHDLLRPLNASSVHQTGQRAAALLEEARSELAALLNLQPAAIVFTSGATEANNMALRGFAAAFTGRTGRPARLLCSPIEHACVRESCRALAGAGAAEVAWMEVSPAGRALLPSGGSEPADLFCLMAAQNETGVVQDLDRARELRLATGARWLCDVTQSFALLPTDAFALGADFLSFSSHKIGGPPGVGVLAGQGLREITPLITGGPQENELRAGTQPVALIRGFVLAARLAAQERQTLRGRMEHLERVFLEALDGRGVAWRRNGGDAPRLPGFLNLSFPGFDGPDLVIALDARGFAVSSGSACATGVMETSEALAAMFPGDPARAAGAVRITPGRETGEEEMRALADALGAVAGRGGPDAVGGVPPPPRRP